MKLNFLKKSSFEQKYEPPIIISKIWNVACHFLIGNP